MDLIVLSEDYDGDIEAGLSSLMDKNDDNDNDNLYVAVSKDVEKSESLVLWAIQNSGGRQIFILHVHQPDHFIPILGKKHHWNSLEEQQVISYRKIERQLMLRTLDAYLDICRQFEVVAEKLYIETDSIENGMLQLISLHNIEKLVMGAASDDNYHGKLKEPKSKKAIYLQLHAPASCHIWFICKGHLIHERIGNSQVGHVAENEPSTNSRTLPMVRKFHNDKSEIFCQGSSSKDEPYFGAGDRKIVEFASMDNLEIATVSQSHIDLEANCHEWSEILRWSGAQGSNVSTGSSSRVSRESTDPLDPRTGQNSEQIHPHPYSPPPVALLEDFVGDELSEQIKQTMAKAKYSTRVTTEEFINCKDPEAEAVLREKSSESLYVEEMRRKEVEVELAKVKNDRERLMEELQVTLSQNSELESRVMNYDHVVKVLEEGMISNVELLQIYEKERDDLKVERDNVLKTAEELLNQSAEASSKPIEPKYFLTMSFMEIKEATNDFDPSFQLWEGENGSIYKGIICHSPVTIRMWHSDGLQGPKEFHNEVEILSKFRHPNLVTLIGVCHDAWSLVYEYLPYGNLKDRLSCKDDTPPLSWQTRIRIATDICSTLIFLHSRTPERVVHGALKPSSCLLDSNFNCKMSDFEFARLIPQHEDYLHSELTYSSGYIDPEFFVTGQANPGVDVYSFGMIVLELLTGKPAYGMIEELEDALQENEFGSVLDTSAGEWPFVQAEQLAKLALRCCDENSSNRPDLEREIWRVLEPMRASFGGLQYHNLVKDENRQAPSYFICPIFQEVMKDPHVAADGYTYEAEALRGWLDTGHDTSPMTNLQLHHTDLVPNHALRSAIQEWRQQHE